MLNPGGRLLLKEPQEWPEAKEQQGKGPAGREKKAMQERLPVDDDSFRSDDLYISFMSERSCTLNLVCQFPTEVSEEDDKPSKKERTNVRSEKAIRAKFADFIAQQIQELSTDDEKREAYFKQV